MHFGFSYVGLIFLIMLFLPNFFGQKTSPKIMKSMWGMRRNRC